MKDDSTKTIIAIVLIALIPCLLVLGLVSVEPVHQSSPTFQDSKSGDGNRPKEIGESFWQRTTHDPVASFTAVLTASTVGLFWATFFLWRSTERLVRGAEASSRHQLRAYVAFDGLRTNRVHGDNGKLTALSFTPAFKNFGQTVATQVVGYTCLAFSSDPEGRDIDYAVNALPTGPSAISPGQDDWSPTTRDILIPELSEIAENGTAIVIFGAVNYTDIFENKRRTEFSLYYEFSGWDIGSRKTQRNRSELYV